MAISKRKYKKGRLSNTDRNRLFITGILCTVGAVLLCIEGWIPWVGSALYLAGLVNWVVSAFRSEQLTVLDHSEFTLTIPIFFIWLLWGKVEITMNGSYLIYSLVFSLILSALFILMDSSIEAGHVSLMEILLLLEQPNYPTDMLCMEASRIKTVHSINT